MLLSWIIYATTNITRKNHHSLQLGVIYCSLCITSTYYYYYFLLLLNYFFIFEIKKFLFYLLLLLFATTYIYIQTSVRLRYIYSDKVSFWWIGRWVLIYCSHYMAHTYLLLLYLFISWIKLYNYARFFKSLLTIFWYSSESFW